jgi:hypothetical protein
MNFCQRFDRSTLMLPKHPSELPGLKGLGLGLGRICQSAHRMCGSAPTTAVDPLFNAACLINGESHVHRWRHSWNYSARSSHCLLCAQGVSHRARLPVANGCRVPVRWHGPASTRRILRRCGPAWWASSAGDWLRFPQERAGLPSIEPCRLKFEVCLPGIQAHPSASRRTAVL